MARETRGRQKLKSAAPSAHFQRIENTVGPGTPDENFCLFGHEFWVEWKQCTRPRSRLSPIRIRFERDQIPWIVQGNRAGRKIFVGICVDRDVYFLSGRDIEVLYKKATYSPTKVVITVSQDGLEALDFNLPEYLRGLADNVRI